MENNNPVSSQPTPSQPPSQPQATNVESKSTPNKSMMIVVGAMVAVMFALASGGYWWYTNQMASSTKNYAPNEVTVKGLNTLMEELNSIEVSAVESDLKDIDKDLQEL